VGEMLQRAKDSKIDSLDLLAEVRKRSSKWLPKTRLIFRKSRPLLVFQARQGFVSYRKLPRKPESCIDRLEDAIHNMSDTEAQKQLTGIA
jgi:hypothetical protein